MAQIYKIVSLHVTGVFTAPVSGTWSISYNLIVTDFCSTNNNYADAELFIYKNGKSLGESRFSSHIPLDINDLDYDSTGGRTFTMHLDEGDTLYLASTRLTARIVNILTCFTFLSV